jgi:CBS domain containing-hemolysin-like protein
VVLSGIDAVYLALAAFLVFLNGFFVAAEFAIVKIRPTQVEALHRRGDPRANVAQSILDNLDAYLGVTQLGITAASLGLGWVGEPAIARLIEPVLAAGGITNPTVLHSTAFVIAFSIITFLHVVVGELAPKSLAIRHTVGTTRHVARPMQVFYYLSWPAMKLFNGSALLLLRALGVDPEAATTSLHSEAEIEHIVTRLGESQMSSSLARDVLSNVFFLRRLTVRQIMTHRTQVVALDLGDPLPENLDRARASGHARFPVVDGDIDDVVGVVHLKDIAFLAEDEDPDLLRSLAHPPVVVPETATLDQALVNLLDANQKMAIVADEHGGMEGIVTTEDLLEELVGEIEDTFDEEPADYVRLPGDRVLLRGDAPLHDVEHLIGLTSEDPDVATVGGLIVKVEGRVPARGESVEIGGWRFTVMDRTERQVREVIATEIPTEADTDADEDADDG